MYGWDAMQPTLYDYQNWSGFKTEPMDFTVDQKVIKTEPSPASPQSIASNESQQNTMFSEQPPTSTPMYTPMRQHMVNPLTPPGYNPAQQPSVTSKEHNTSMPQRSYEPTESLTPSSTPPMDMTPPKTPKYLADSPTDNLDNDVNSFSGDDVMDSDDDLRTPKMNSHGKVKTFKCKQCEFIAVTKLDFWDHTKSHIKPEKMLNCPKCPFVTEYKHHLEYHMRNHDGSKPFRCTQCSYSCVNKSMLNSHLKSHSNIYQFRCADCNYATKYCHSLKLHLRKYDHKPGMVLNMDGTPNPLPVIDVYGTRRGPKNKNGKRMSKMQGDLELEGGNETLYSPKSDQQNMQLSPIKSAQNLQNMVPSLLANPFANMLNHQAQNFSAMFPYLNFNIQMLAAHQQAIAGKLPPTFAFPPQLPSPVGSNHLSDDEDYVSGGIEEQSAPLNLESSPSSKVSPKKSEFTNSPTVAIRSKKISFNLEANQEVESTTSSVDAQKPSTETTAIAAVSTVSESDSDSQVVRQIGRIEIYECKFCEIVFKDALLHTIHMGYHGYNDVFKCNSCGEKCSDRVSFFLHIARSSHN